MLMTEHGPVLVETLGVLVVFGWYINFAFCNIWRRSKRNKGVKDKKLCLQ
jgi:hypothetical protein